MSSLPDFRAGWTQGGTPQDQSPEIVGDQSTEDLARNGRNSGQYEREYITCPECGDDYGNLPLHLPGCDGGAE